MILELFALLITGALFALVVCGSWLLFAPEFAKRSTNWMRAKPRATLRYGFVCSLVFPLVLVGLVFIAASLAADSLPLAVTYWIELPIVLTVVLAAMAQGLAFLAAGRIVTDDRIRALLVAMTVSAIVAGLSPLVLVLTPMGVGGAVFAYRYGEVDIVEQRQEQRNFDSA